MTEAQPPRSATSGRHRRRVESLLSWAELRGDWRFRPIGCPAGSIVLVMAGVEGLGRGVVAGLPGSDAAALAASLDHLGLQVNRENVLQVRKALLTEADRLAGLIFKATPTLLVLPPGGDPVSGPATDALNEKIDGVTARCNAEIAVLRQAGAVLADTARRYGIAEQEIQDSFKGIQPGSQAPPPESGWTSG